jgi:hypothetical protein
VVLSIPGYDEVYSVESVANDSRTNFTLSAKTTRLTLKGEQLLKFFNDRIRDIVVFAQSEELAFAERPIVSTPPGNPSTGMKLGEGMLSPIEGDRILLDAWMPDLEKGRTLIVSGKQMRVQVAPEASKLELIGQDGSRSPLKPGDSLQVLVSPAPDPSNPTKILWHLADKNGFSGFVSAIPGSFTLIPASEVDVPVSEVVFVKTVEPGDAQHTQVQLTKPLGNSFDRATVTVYANVARATHGETKQEVLGAGAGSQAFQKFALKQKPLTYVSAPTPSGGVSTLEVRVDSLLWDEASTLYQLPPEKRAYITRLADDGTVTVEFGDGETGARLPSGVENVSAKYRVGTGLAGLVDAGQINQLMTRPLGVKGVTNPLKPSGAADPEKLDQARRNAPLTVLTLDRIVSLQDFEDFASAFAGIGKAQATLLWNGERRLVHLTVASAAGAAVDPASDLHKNLLAGIDAARHADQQVRVDSFQLLQFTLGAKILVDKRAVSANVLAAVKANLVKTFSFEAREFGQAVTASEVLAAIQSVASVVAADLDTLNGADPFEYPRLLAHVAHWESSQIKPAEIWTVNPAGIKLTEMTP